MPPPDTDYLDRLNELARPFGYGDDRATVHVVGVAHHQVDVEVRHEDTVARWWLALPSSQRPMPWLMFHSTDDPDGWLSDLRDWLNEEVSTVGIATGAARQLDADGVVRVVTEGYGLRHADQINHVRLRRIIGPHGWGRRRTRRRYRLEYALEWALDSAEHTLRTVTTADPLRPREPLRRQMYLDSPDGIACVVEVARLTTGWELTARPGRPTHRSVAGVVSPARIDELASEYARSDDEVFGPPVTPDHAARRDDADARRRRGSTPVARRRFGPVPGRP